MLYQDIPRIYTAIAEWGSCLVYLYILKKENMKSVHFLTGSLFMLAMQSIFLTMTGNVTEILWIPRKSLQKSTRRLTGQNKKNCGLFTFSTTTFLREQEPSSPVPVA